MPLLLKMVQPLPTQRGLIVGTAFDQRPRLGLDLLLDLAAEAVGVGEAELDLQALWWQRRTDVGFAGERGGAGGLPLRRVVGVGLPRAAEAVEVVDDARRGVSQQAWSSGVRVGRVKEGVELSLREVGDEAGERVTFHRRGQRLAHHGGAHHHAQCVEGHLGPVAVRVADQARLQDAVVVDVHRHPVAESVTCFRHQQVVGVEVNESVLTEGVAVASRQEEMLPRLCQFSGCSIERVGGEERLPRRDPPMIVGIGRGEAPVGFHCLASQIATPVAGLPAEHGCRVGQQGLGGLTCTERWKTWSAIRA